MENGYIKRNENGYIKRRVKMNMKPAAKMTTLKLLLSYCYQNSIFIKWM